MAKKIYEYDVFLIKTKLEMSNVTTFNVLASFYVKLAQARVSERRLLQWRKCLHWPAGHFLN